jgi:hypothetical protein
MAQAAVLDVDVNVKVAGSNPANLKLFELGLFGLLADGGDFVGGHFLCRAKKYRLGSLDFKEGMTLKSTWMRVF